MYAIVDIETTGGHADVNGITEIAIIIHNGKRKIQTYHTLINPEIPIPRYISGLTGITDEMVNSAPVFNEVAETIHDLIKDKIFVAHNVNFDYSFVRHQLKLAGINWDAKKMCTVRMSRKIFPGHKSYSLGNICAALKINIKNRHRAMGDAEATAKLFDKLIKHDTEGALNEHMKKSSREQILPANLPAEQFHSLSQKCGVYYFHDGSGKVIYVGKAIHIKKRVAQHFSGNKTNKQRQDFLRNIHHISFEETATELMSLILESVEIKKHWPEYNRAQKRIEFTYGIYDYEDRNGYIRLCIDRVRKHTRPVVTFKTLSEAFATMQQIVSEAELCAKLCMLDTSRDECNGYEKGICRGACNKHETPEHYNQRVQQTIDNLSQAASYAIIDKGLEKNQNSCILIEKGKFYGMGYIPADAVSNNMDTIKMFIKPRKETFFIRELIASDKLLNKGRVISLTENETSHIPASLSWDNTQFMHSA